MDSVIEKRPKLLTIVCVCGFFWIVFSFPSVFSPSVKKLGDWYPAMFGLIVAITFISYIGLWHLKRWGVSLFLIAFFIKQSLLLLINDLSYPGLVISILFIFVIVFYYKQMDVNL